MDRPISLFLDVCRFSAAMAVFLGHTSGQLFTGGIFWQFGDYMQTAVVVFFLLSGYITGFVVNPKEKTASLFTISRLARLYSVVLPALILTFICDGTRSFD
jgi:peptidoglycan/LPS O-acetylase OafA/YrhL